VLFIHGLPTGGSLLVTPSTGTPLSTQFRVSTTGWTDSVLANMGDASSISARQAVVSAGAGLPQSKQARAALLVVAQGGSLGAPASFTPPSSNCPALVGASTLNLPAWFLSQAALGAALGLDRDSTCTAIEAGVANALTISAATTASIVPPPAATFTIGFRLDAAANDADAGSASFVSALVDPAQVSLVAFATNAVAISSVTGWSGTPLAPLGAASSITTNLPVPFGRTSTEAGAVMLFAYVRSSEGVVTLVAFPVALQACLPVSATATDISDFVFDVAISTLNDQDVEANPYAALSTVSSLGSVLNGVTAGGSALDPAQTVANANLRSSLANVVQVAVLGLASNLAQSSTGVASVLGLPPSSLGASGPADTDAALATLTQSQLAALRTDTAILVDDGTLSSVTASLMAITSGSPAELSPACLNSTFNALDAVLSSSLPTSVAWGFAPTYTGAGNVAGIAPFPQASGNAVLSVLVSLAAADSSDTARAKSGSVMRSLAAAMNRAASPGSAPQSVTAGPSAAFMQSVVASRRLQAAVAGSASLPSYCGPALSLTTARVASGSQTAVRASVAMTAPLAPCFAAGSIGGIVDTPPAPSVTFGDDTLRAVGSAAPGGALDVTLISAGVPSVSSTAGWSAAIIYKVPSVSTDALNVFGPVGQPAGVIAGSAQAAIIALGLSSASNPVTVDLTPTTGLDSRVLSVSLQTIAGEKVAVQTSASPISLSLPLLDPGATSGATPIVNGYTINASSFIFVCPLESTLPAQYFKAYSGSSADVMRASSFASAVQPVLADGAPLLGWAASSSASSLGLAPVDVLITTTQRITYLSRQLNRDASSCDLPFSSCSGSSALSLPYAVEGINGVLPRVGSQVVVVSSAIFTLEIPCGAPVNKRTVTCGPGEYGRVITFPCPAVSAQPQCGTWNAATNGWSTVGCEAVTSSNGGVTCACSHLSDFALHFATVATDGNDIFVVPPFFMTPALMRSNSMLIVVAAIFGVFGALFFCVITSDKAGNAAFYATLLADEEVQFLARVEAAKGRIFVLDRILDKDGEVESRLAAVAPGFRINAEEGPEQEVQQYELQDEQLDFPPAEDVRPLQHPPMPPATPPSIEQVAASPVEAVAVEQPAHYEICAQSPPPAEAAAVAQPAVAVAVAQPVEAAAVAQPVEAAAVAQPIEAAAVAQPIEAAAVAPPHRVQAAATQPVKQAVVVAAESVGQAAYSFPVPVPQQQKRAKSITPQLPQPLVAPWHATHVPMRTLVGRGRGPVPGVPGAPVAHAVGKHGRGHMAMRGVLHAHAATRAHSEGEVAVVVNPMRRQPSIKELQTAKAGLVFEHTPTCLEALCGGMYGENGVLSRLVPSEEVATRQVEMGYLYLKVAQLRAEGDADSLREAAHLAADLAEMELASREGDPYATAVYMRVMAAFEPLRVTADKAVDVVGAASDRFAVLTAGGHSSVPAPLQALADAPATPRGSGTRRRGSTVVSAAVGYARNAANALDERSSCSCVRAWRLRRFLVRLWRLRVRYVHPYLSPFTAYDPSFPRAGRLLVSAAGVFTSLFFTAFFYAQLHAKSRQDLPELGALNVLILALCAAAVTAPAVTFFWTPLIAASGKANFTRRYPYLASELSRRRAAEARLAVRSRRELQSELAVVAPEGARTSAATPRQSRGSRPSFLWSAAENGLLSASAAAAGEAAMGEAGTIVVVNPMTPRATPGSPAFLAAGRHRGALSPTRADAFTYGWVDEPVSIRTFCGCIVSAAGRDAETKAAFVKQARVAEVHRMNARTVARRKAEEARVKRGGQMVAADLLHDDDLNDLLEADSTAGLGWLQQSAGAAFWRMLQTQEEGKPPAGRGRRPSAVATMDATRRPRRLVRVHQEAERALNAEEDRIATEVVAKSEVDCWDTVLPCVCDGRSALALLAVLAWIAFTLYYLFWWAVSQPESVTSSFLRAWALALGLALFVVHPLFTAVRIFVDVALTPVWAPLLLWMPCGRTLVGREQAAALTADGSTSLSGRLEMLAIVRAAGVASRLPPEAALLALGPATAVTASMLGGPRRVGGVDSHVEAERHELIVRRYVLAQLRAAEAAVAHRMVLAEAREKLEAAKEAAAALEHAEIAARLADYETRLEMQGRVKTAAQALSAAEAGVAAAVSDIDSAGSAHLHLSEVALAMEAGSPETDPMAPVLVITPRGREGEAAAVALDSALTDDPSKHAGLRQGHLPHLSSMRTEFLPTDAHSHPHAPVAPAVPAMTSEEIAAAKAADKGASPSIATWDRCLSPPHPPQCTILPASPSRACCGS